MNGTVYTEAHTHCTRDAVYTVSRVKQNQTYEAENQKGAPLPRKFQII